MVRNENSVILYYRAVVGDFLVYCHLQSMTVVYNVAVKYDIIGCNFNIITTNTVIAFPTSGSVLILSVCTYNNLVLNKSGGHL